MVRLRHLGRKKKFFGRHMSKSQKWKRFSFHLPYVFLLPKWSTTSKKWFILFSLHLPCFLLLYPFPITVHQSFAVSPFFVCLFSYLHLMILTVALNCREESKRPGWALNILCSCRLSSSCHGFCWFCDFPSFCVAVFSQDLSCFILFLLLEPR